MLAFFPLFLISLCWEGFNHIQICKLNDIGAQSNLIRAKKYYYKQRLYFISALEIYQPQFCLYELKLVNFSFHKFLRKLEILKKHILINIFWNFREDLPQHIQFNGSFYQVLFLEWFFTSFPRELSLSSCNKFGFKSRKMINQ